MRLHAQRAGAEGGGGGDGRHTRNTVRVHARAACPQRRAGVGGVWSVQQCKRCLCGSVSSAYGHAPMSNFCPVNLRN